MATVSTRQNVLIRGRTRTRVSLPTWWWCSVAVVICSLTYRLPYTSMSQPFQPLSTRTRQPVVAIRCLIWSSSGSRPSCLLQ